MKKLNRGASLTIIVLVAATLRFAYLLHDAPHFFHPDERNMANAITLFRLPRNRVEIPRCLVRELTARMSVFDPTTDCNLNPHFFSYGQFPLYLAFVSDQFSKPIVSFWNQRLSTIDQRLTDIEGASLSTDFRSAIFWLRFWSALSSTATVLLVYAIARDILDGNRNRGIIAALMTAFTPGLIQAAHFGTTESLLTFFFLASIALSIKIVQNAHQSSPSTFFIQKIPPFVLLSLCIGLALGTKLTGLFLLPAPLLAMLILWVKNIRNNTSVKIKCAWTGTLFLLGALMVLLSVAIGIGSSFYNLLEYQHFKSAVFGYEADVATGRFQAFYTQQFVNTTPVLFQAGRIFPFTLGWPMFLLGLAGLVIAVFQLVSTRSHAIAILLVPTILYVVPNAFLYAKWTRFMTPVFPVFAIFASLVVSQFPQSIKKLVLILSMIPGLAFMSIYTSEDTRVQATRWIVQHIPSNAHVLFETGNVIDIPLGGPQFTPPPGYNLSLTSFDFYHLDENPSLLPQLVEHLAEAKYIVIPSRRIFANYYLRESQNFPLLTRYYQRLFSGELGFEQVEEIASYPRLGPWVFPDENAEETFTVFDHPVVRIYKKVRPLEQSVYESLLKYD